MMLCTEPSTEAVDKELYMVADLFFKIMMQLWF